MSGFLEISPLFLKRRNKMKIFQMTKSELSFSRMSDYSKKHRLNYSSAWRKDFLHMRSSKK